MSVFGEDILRRDPMEYEKINQVNKSIVAIVDIDIFEGEDKGGRYSWSLFTLEDGRQYRKDGTHCITVYSRKIKELLKDPKNIPLYAGVKIWGNGRLRLCHPTEIDIDWKKP